MTATRPKTPAHVGVLAVAMAIALADTSIVTLALPQLESDLNTGVTGVASVLFVYAAVLAIGLPIAGRLAGGRSARRWACSGFGVMVLASIMCAIAGSLGVLLAGRVLQAAGAGVALVGGFALIDGAGRGRHAWRMASIVGVAVGPALGGALTQLFDWRAIFIAQAPVALAGAWSSLRPAVADPAGAGAPDLPAVVPADSRRRERPPGSAGRLTARAALALVSAALAAVLFLVVLLVIAGWSVSPLSGALAVTPLPVAAALAFRIRGPARARAVAGCALVGAGVLALAWIPAAHLAWIVPPEIVAGLGMGCALGALSGELLPERTPREAAGLLSIRHAGVAVVLLVLASIIAGQLETATHTAELRGVALLLDSSLSPTSKLSLAPSLITVANARDPRASLRTALAGQRHNFTGADRTAFDLLATRADDTVIQGIQSSFHLAFVISGVLAFLAAGLLALGPGPRAEPGDRRRLTAPTIVAVAVACVATPVAYAVLDHHLAPATAEIGNPCGREPSPSAGGIGGVLENGIFTLLDNEACRLHTSREELVLALVDPAEGARFTARHPGFNAAAITKVIEGLLNS